MTDAQIEAEMREQGYSHGVGDAGYIGDHGEYPPMRRMPLPPYTPRSEGVNPLAASAVVLLAYDDAAKMMGPFVKRAKPHVVRWRRPTPRVLPFVALFVLSLVVYPALVSSALGLLAAVALVSDVVHAVARDEWEAVQDVIADDYAAGKFDYFELDGIAEAWAEMSLLDDAERAEFRSERLSKKIEGLRVGQVVVLEGKSMFVGIPDRGHRAGKKCLFPLPLGSPFREPEMERR